MTIATDACRRRYLLNYFGEDTATDTCEMSDNDVSRAFDTAGYKTLALAVMQARGLLQPGASADPNVA